MHKPFHPTLFNLWRYRKRLILGEGTSLAPSATFSINRNSSIRLGHRCNVGLGAVLATYGGMIEIGDDVGINPYSVLYGHGGLRIGNGVRIAAHCVIVPANHGIDQLDLPIHAQPLTKRGIEIGDDVWIGANCVVLDGTVIGSGAVIVAGSVVRGEVESRAVYGGSPARKLRDRGARREGKVIDVK